MHFSWSVGFKKPRTKLLIIYVLRIHLIYKQFPILHLFLEPFVITHITCFQAITSSLIINSKVFCLGQYFPFIDDIQYSSAGMRFTKVKTLGWNSASSAMTYFSYELPLHGLFHIERFFSCLPPGFLSVVGRTEQWWSLQHLAQPCYVALGQALNL